MKSIFHDTKVDVISLATVDNAIVTGSAVDMAGFEGVAFVAAVTEGAVYSGYELKAQQDSSSTFGTNPKDLTGSAISFACLTGTVSQVLDINRPSDRYVRPVLTVPNVSATCDVAIVAIRYGPRVMPQSNTGEYHSSPSEGTA